MKAKNRRISIKARAIHDGSTQQAGYIHAVSSDAVIVLQRCNKGGVHIYACAPAAQIGPFAYATILFATVIGWSAWGEVPDAMTVAGAVIVVLAGVMAIRFGGRSTLPAKL